MKRFILSLLILFLTLNISDILAQCPDGTKIDTKNVVLNGDFCRGNTGFTTDYKYDRNDLLEEGTYTIVSNPKFVHQGFRECFDHSNNSGMMMVVNGSNVDNMVVWQQDVPVLPNTTYFFSTWISSMTDKGNVAKLQFSINNVPLGKPFEADPSSCKWTQFFTTWESGNNRQVKISIINKNVKKSGNDFALDDITFYPCLPMKLDNKLETLGIGESIELRNIFFESGQYTLKPESYDELDYIAEYLNQNPNVKVEIAGHTDNIGSDAANQLLSEDRAKSVVTYLMGKLKKGKDRLSFKGYGETKPIASNETYEGRQLNRRVELIIISK